MIRRPPRSTLDRSSAASDVYKRQSLNSAQITSRCSRGGVPPRHVKPIYGGAPKVARRRRISSLRSASGVNVIGGGTSGQKTEIFSAKCSECAPTVLASLLLCSGLVWYRLS